MAPEPRHFGPFTLDPVKGELLRGTYRVPLQPQPLRLLILLTDHAGELVTRDQIRDAIWGKDTFVEFEHALNFAISQVRATLRDSKTTPRYIRTEPRRGYRFIAPLDTRPRLQPASEPPAAPQPVPPAESQPPPITAAALHSPDLQASSPAPATAPEPRPQAPPVSAPDAPQVTTPGFLHLYRKPLWAAAALLVLLPAAWMLLHRQPPAEQSTSIAVLPVINLTGDPANELIADGLTDELIARLAALGENHLRVTARTSSMFYKGKPVTAAIIGHDLNAAYMLESSLRLQPASQPPAGRSAAPAGLRLTTQLIRTADDSHLWTRMFDTSQSQLFATTGTLASSVLAALPLPHPAATPAGYVSPSPQAREAFLRGQHFFSLRSREGLSAARESFLAATVADPAYAEAYARLAATYLILGSYSSMPQKDAAALAEAALTRALAIDPTLPDAYAARGHLRWFYQWNWAGGEQDFLNAIHRDANNVDAMHWYALSLATSRRGAEAEVWMRRALELDPKSLILRANLGVIQAINGNLQQGADTIEAELRENPSFFSGRLKLWGIYTALRRDDDAFRQMSIVYNAGEAFNQMHVIEEVYQRQGYRAAINLWRSRPGYIGALVESQIALADGDTEGAIQTLLRGFREHDGWMVYVFTDPALKPLLGDPRLRPVAHALAPTPPPGTSQF